MPDKVMVFYSHQVCSSQLSMMGDDNINRVIPKRFSTGWHYL